MKALASAIVNDNYSSNKKPNASDTCIFKSKPQVGSIPGISPKEMPEGFFPIDPYGDPLGGKQVFVTPGKFRESGIGVVVVDRGYGSLRTLEVELPSGRIQYCRFIDALVEQKAESSSRLGGAA
ncbi:MAG: hypothetical protein F6J86_15435 [Symploca sp. SIO1B1]|nr:hypothetical protein [Symploca sp. SIO1C2]NER50129.1 hypothetical protein [Symploca sp. SIO1A3]NER95204.1 hypothetical protein [Symploca sp. SIO1B1]